jgi:DNA-binding MarR family transcriptional regulator
MWMSGPQGYEAMQSVLRLHQVMTSIVGAELKAGFRLRLIDYLTLRALQDSESGTESLGRLAQRLGVHATTITIATERLEDRNLIRRRAHPSDKRATLARITAEGRALADAATTRLGKVDFGLAGLTQAQTRSLAGLMPRVSQP